MDTAPIVAPKQSLTLDLPPSCLQFCREHPAYFVIGTYNLQRGENAADEGPADEASSEKKPQSRNGSLLVFHVDTEASKGLTLVQTVSQPSALLDIRFNNETNNNRDILAAVSSTGTLAIFKLDPVNPSAPLQHISTSRCDDMGEDVLFLQCKWHPVLPNVVAVTCSTGNARLLYLDESWRISHYSDVNIPNSLEAWSIAISPCTESSKATGGEVTVYCGGDDSMLRYTSCAWSTVDVSASPEEQYSPITIKGKHDAGVTAILPLDLKGEQGGRVVITGSYDDCLRVFIIHDLHESYGARRVDQVLEQNLGGGVWRLDLVKFQKEHLKTQITLLASCMHAGARVVKLDMNKDGSWSAHVLARFEEHKSMNYASDFVSGEAPSLACVSSSFYDRLLCLWECELEEDVLR